jgi:RNA polymerase sigma-70 factor, ECF subfamily
MKGRTMAAAENIALLRGAFGAGISAEDIGVWLGEALASGRAAWPTVHLGEHEYVAHVIRHAKGGPPLASLHASDLYLAAACGLGLPAALVAFETYRGDIASIVRRVSSAVDVEELMQNLRELLFVGRAGVPPKIHDYSGRGELRAWLRVVATRASLNAATRGPKERPTAEDDELVAAAGAETAEVMYFRLHYDAEVKRALPHALASLSPRDRLFLRQHYLDQLTLDELARIHAVHVATVKRHLASAREALSDNLRLLLSERLKLSPSELRSVLAIVQSRLHLTMRRLLPEEEGSG